MIGRAEPQLQDETSLRQAVERRVRSAGTSFFWAMRFLPKPKRDAMFAVYAFCREVDDIADGDGSAADKRTGLNAWRDEIAALYQGRPTTLFGQALAEPLARFELEQSDFLAIIAGVEMDAQPANSKAALVAPPMAELLLYCDRVACAVGRLSVRIFGAEREAGLRLAASLGLALQLTNVLRDMAEDAAIGRLYLPRELLEKHGIATNDPAAAIRHPKLPLVADELAQMAFARYAEAAALIEVGPKQALRPAAVMMAVYRRVLERLVRRGWQKPEQAVGLSPVEKLWIGLRHGLM
jgi:phytoene synthase